MAPPVDKVWVPSTRSPSLAVKVCEPTTTTAGGVVVGEGRVMTSPPWVMAPPGNRVWEPIMKPEFELAVMLEFPITTTPGGVLVGITPLTMMAPSELADITCPPAVIAEPGTKV